MNIYDIAKKANVSTATVSRVLNNPETVKEETRKKVQKIIDKYGYKPSHIARGLATNKTNTIGIMVPDIRNPFHANSAFLLEQNLVSKGYNSILCNTSEEPEQKLKYFELLNQKGVDGIILLGASYGDKVLEERFEELNKSISIVLINNIIGDNSTFVICDEKNGLDQSIGYLKSKDYKNPIYIQDKQKYITRASVSKKEGFLKAIKKYYPNLINENLILELKEDLEEYEKIIEFLKSNVEVDSIQFEKDTSAIKFLKVAQKYNIEIPEKLAVIGFDNIDLTNYTYKSLSTIDHKIEEHCNIAIDLLIKKMNGETVKNNNYIIPKFIKKETS
ncbi:LacI family DNA-binding transcriptional regulator [Miniphocaeibacter halophilus]|uniref:LacI family DNA-binding transcriptional regulator n=1 Tax=Miniphocaeibacter halophilus TaxID=2931922 RepID=A0AC61MTU8_9FIRM|nr:LacI family DNA-binding transcriptional regulator [Miniphocaeibacter halophilus]QQK07786.1 LacI family DNA-binding transcriptional regulator [Miniphocaeibacter halophilus]